MTACGPGIETTRRVAAPSEPDAERRQGGAPRSGLATSGGYRADERGVDSQTDRRADQRGGAHARAPSGTRDGGVRAADENTIRSWVPTREQLKKPVSALAKSEPQKIYGSHLRARQLP